MAKIQGSTEYTKSTELDTGVFASKQTVVKIINSSNHPSLKQEVTIGQNGFVPDLCLKVTFGDESGKEIEKFIFGKYLKDKITGNIKGWITQGNAVLSFIYACVGKDNVNVNEDYSIPDLLLAKCLDKEIWKIDYVNREYLDKTVMKPGYQMLNTFFSATTKETQLVEYWQEKKTYIKDYQPNIYRTYIKRKEDEDTSFNYGANKTKDDSLDESVI